MENISDGILATLANYGKHQRKIKESTPGLRGDTWYVLFFPDDSFEPSCEDQERALKHNR